MTTLVPGLPPFPVQQVIPPLHGPWLPRSGEPGWTLWPRRVWPIDPLSAAPRVSPEPGLCSAGIRGEARKTVFSAPPQEHNRGLTLRISRAAKRSRLDAVVRRFWRMR